MVGLYIGLSLIALALPFLVSLFVAVDPKVRPSSIADYFLYESRLKSDDFLTTSVGYSLQAAAIFLFLYWTFTYGLSSLFVPVVWGLGYVLVCVAIRSGRLDSFLKTTNNSQQIMTIHGYAGSPVSSLPLKRTLVFLLAIATIIGLGGTLIAEVDYALSFVISAVGLSNGQNADWFNTGAEIAILVFTGCYVLWGGYKAVVRTDAVQVPFAYISFGVVTLGVALLGVSAGHAHNTTIIGILISLLFATFFATRWFFIFRSSNNDSESASLENREGSTKSFLVFIPLAALGVVIAVIGLNQLAEDGQSFLTMNKETTAWLGFGVFGVLSLAVTNVIWQLIDISSLQRLQSVECVAEDESLSEKARQTICRGLIASGVEGGGAWVLVVLLALSFEAVGVRSIDELAPFFVAREGIFLLLGPLFVFSVVAFTISTVDGFISAMAYVCFYDVLWNAPTSDVEKQLSIARKTTLLLLSFIYIGYHLLKASLPEDGTIAIVLYAIYAVQASIAPTVLTALFWRKYVDGIAGVLSILVGCSFAFLTALSDPINGIATDSWYVLPPLAAVSTSSVTYLFVIIIANVAAKVKA